jgi:hypothetical protein
MKTQGKEKVSLKLAVLKQINCRHVLPPKEALEFLTKVVGRLGAFYKVFDKNGKLLKKEPQPKGNSKII